MSPRARMPALVVLVGLVVGGAPLLLGPPGGDDAYYHAMRAQQQARCWLRGVPFPRWYPDLNGGLGGPEPRAYPIVPLSLHAALALACNDGVAATVVATVLIPPLAGLLMLWAARRRGAGDGAALVAALAWAAAPYLVVALHERAALAEGWGLALLPAVVAGLLPGAVAGRRGVTAAAVALGVLAATQVPLAFMAIVVVAAAHLAVRAWAEARNAALAIASGLALSAISWLPNLDAVGSLAGDRLVSGEYAWSAHLLPFAGMADRALAHELVAVFAGVALAAALVAGLARGTVRGLAAASLVCLLLTTPLAAWAYRWVPGFAFLQFPWRWLALASCLLCLALAGVERRGLRAGAVAAFLAPLLLPMAWCCRLAPGMPLRPGDPGAVVARAATRYGVPPILPSLPAYLPRGVDLGVPLARAAQASAAVGPPAEGGPRRWRWMITSVSPASVAFPLLAAPGWRVELDGRETAWRPLDGLVGMAVPAGAHGVTLTQSFGTADVTGAALSTLALIGLVVWSRARRRAP